MKIIKEGKNYLHAIHWDLLFQHVEDLEVVVHPRKLDVLVFLQDLLVTVNLQAFTGNFEFMTS